jgi:hypothetical protein
LGAKPAEEVPAIAWNPVRLTVHVQRLWPDRESLSLTGGDQGKGQQDEKRKHSTFTYLQMVANQHQRRLSQQLFPLLLRFPGRIAHPHCIQIHW